MTRKEFVKLCGILGVSLPFQSALISCSKDDDDSSSPVNNVIIIGAGAAGMSAGHLLSQRGINFQILEASSRHGGRMKRTTDFADFPIPLGAEWLHVEKGVLNQIVNDPSVSVNINTTPYNSSDVALYNGAQVSMADVGFTIDQKFINSTWYDFFEEYILPSVASRISYDTVVNSIDYSGDQVIVRTANQEYTADKIIFTAPLKILQSGAISFTPALPDNKLNAINTVEVWDGCKAFIEFSTQFYPTAVAFDITPETDGQKLYYDAAYGQNTNQNILGLFAVGTGTQPYLQLQGNDLIDYMLNELDGLLGGQATPNYIKHTFQNWNEEPYAKGAYLVDHSNWRQVRTLGESVNDKVYFAGTAYTDGTDWGGVHAAALAAKRAVEEMVG